MFKGNKFFWSCEHVVSFLHSESYFDRLTCKQLYFYLDNKHVRIIAILDIIFNSEPMNVHIG